MLNHFIVNCKNNMNEYFCNRFPTDAAWASQWYKRIREYDSEFKREKMSVVCSLHFSKSSMHPSTRQLVDHAIPVAFPSTKVQPAKNSNETEQTERGQSAQTQESKIACCIDGCTTIFDTNVQIPGFRYDEYSLFNGVDFGRVTMIYDHNIFIMLNLLGFLRVRNVEHFGCILFDCITNKI